MTVTEYGDSALFRVQIPSGYDSSRPPAIIVGWHALGGSQIEIFDWDWDEICEQRGWIIASHMGPNDRHWNTRLPQLHCRAMLEWLEERFPFSRDSIYMCGASMGAAAGQVWHNNNCAYDDYLIAATAGGSQILDCQLRQEQYLAIGDTNRSMRAAFGGFPFESDSVAYEYHRYSAVHLADTTESMHFNCLTVPVWSNWGSEEFEWNAYGYAAEEYAVLRQHGAESRFAAQGWEGHGFWILVGQQVCQWFAQFSADRFPDTLSLAADEDGRYYYCDITLGNSAYTFARCDIRKERESKTLDIAIMQNVAELKINFVFPWGELDTLYCNWETIDPVSPAAVITLAGLTADLLASVNHTPYSRVSENGEWSFDLHGSSEFTLTFSEVADTVPNPVPYRLELVRAFPNPFNSELTLVFTSNEALLTTVNFYDLRGRLAHSLPLQIVPETNQFTLSLPQLASGSYWIRSRNSAPFKVVLIR